VYAIGDKVWVARNAPRLGAVTPIVDDAATLRYRYGGRYPSGDLWVVTLASGVETIASESMMQPA